MNSGQHSIIVVVVVVTVVVAVVVVVTVVDEESTIEDPLGEATDDGELLGGFGSGQVSSKTLSLAA